ncbi:unnamed protein product [Peronospora effusa]|nr:unnamed protein product [Peronospora effusa]
MEDDGQHKALRKFSKLQPELLCATVVEPLPDLDQWGVLNVLCVLLPHLAPVENETKVVMPQSKAALYHLSKEVNCWTFSTEDLSAAQGADLSGGAKKDTIRRRRRAMLKASQRPRENSIVLHSQNVAGFPKHPERCAEWFGHFRQRETRCVIVLVLLQETRVSIGEAARLNNLYSTTWGFVDKPGRTRWTESEAARGGVAILLNPETIFVVSLYAPSDKTAKEGVFEMFRHHLLGHDGPLFAGGNFNCPLRPRIDRSFVSLPGRHDSQALRRLLRQAQLCDVLEDDMEREEEIEPIQPFMRRCLHIYTLCLAVDKPVLDLIGDNIRIVAPRHVVRVRKTRHVYSIPGCAQAAATTRQLADWWDEWKIRLRKVLVENTKIARQSLTRSYRLRLKRLYVRLDAALLEARSSAKSIGCAQVICDQPSPVDNPADLRRNVAECRRLWQRTKKERLYVQHTYSTGETSRRSFALVSTKFQDNTIVSLGGQATYGSNRSQELADEMADGWGHLMIKFYDRPDDITAFLELAFPLVRIDDSNVTSVISPDDVCAVLKRLKRGKAAGPDEINNTFYRDYADALSPILEHCTRDGWSEACYRRRLVKRTFNI